MLWSFNCTEGPSCDIFNVLPCLNYEEDENKCFTTALTWLKTDITKEDMSELVPSDPKPESADPNMG